ncbi:hypothetical protein MMC13_005624 [Lambiella insularis]|nr:hypothetical protein [Lambiella insularis]
MDNSVNPSSSRLSKLPLPRASRVPVLTNSAALKQPQNNYHNARSNAGHVAVATVSGTSAAPGIKEDQNLPNGPAQTTLKRRLSLIPAKSSQGTVHKHTAVSESCLPVSTTESVPEPLAEAKPIRKFRPSLSDRTVETLSQIPPSPSPRRRQSGVFPNGSPMRPPSRAASAMNSSRPGSRAALSTTSLRTMGRCESPIKYQSISRIAMQPLSTTPSRRTVSTCVPRNATIPGSNEPSHPPQSPSAAYNQQSSSRLLSTPQTKIRKPLQGSKSMAYRPTPTRAPLQSVFRNEHPENPVNQIAPKNGVKKSIQKIETAREVTEGNQSRGPGLKIRARKPQNDTGGPGDPEISGARKISASSQNLREIIAKAKAARQKAPPGPQSSAAVPRFVEDDSTPGIVLEADPYSLDLSENVTTNVLRQRINMAKADGKLNIAALGLTLIPPEVMKMYESNDIGDIPWYETVDLTRLNAADNDISELNDTAFPSDCLAGHAEQNTDTTLNIFAGLEVVDLHGNQLKAIPIGFGNLLRLTSLNLSRNQLTSDAIGAVSQIHSLRELKLAENALLGPLRPSICDLENLEVLDIHENAISQLPEGMGSLTKLRVLNVGGNKLTSLPFGALAQIHPLKEIVASRNRLEGTLLPPLIMSFSSLHTMEVSHNALVSIADHEIEISTLQSVDISNNRISVLPSSKTWPHLEALKASDNQIKLLPSDFSQLRDLKTVDLSSNSVSKIDDSIGFMDSLVQLHLTNNPLYERRLLNMTAEELKDSLRNRLSSPTSEKFAWAGRQSHAGSNLQSPALSSVKSGVLDQSRSRLRKISATDLETVAMDDEVKSFVLNHNLLQEIHPAISTFATTLVNLDLSHNKLGQNVAYIAGPLALPVLQTLNLTSNALPSLEPLAEHLSAPKLTSLNLSFNRLTSLPLLCKAFPSLSTFLASNNAIVDLDVEAVRGLQTLDVSSNEIEYLPPRLALLQGQMKTLMVGGNKFRVPGWGILEKGTEDILNWCKRRIPAGEEGAVVDDEVD